MSGWLSWVVGFGLSVVAYVLFAGQVSAGEALAAVPAVGLGMTLAVLHHRHAQHPVDLTPAALKPARIVFWAVARDTFLVCRSLFRALFSPRTGAFVSKTVRAGGRDEGGVLVLAESVAPNGYVIQAAEGKLVLHRLAPSP